MPSNKSFIEDITKLAKELDTEVTTEGLNNNQLAALVKDLRAKKAVADKAAADKVAADKAAADKVAADKVAADPKSSRKKGAYYLCKGKAITTRRGILSNGDEIKAEDISGGKKALDDFVETKHLEKG